MKIFAKPLRFSVDHLPKNWPDLIKKIYASRIDHPDEINKKLQYLPLSTSFHQMDKAGEFLFNALINKQKILIISDTSVSGIIATAILISTFKRLKINFETSLDQKISDCLIDNAKLIIAIQNLPKKIKSINKKVILLSEQIVQNNNCLLISSKNPQNQNNAQNLDLSGLILFLLIELQTICKQKNQWQQNFSLTIFLDLIAIAIIASNKNLDFINRILINHGIKMIQSNNQQPAISALINVSQVDFVNLTYEKIHFFLAGRLNALIKHNPQKALDLLLANDFFSAQELAYQADELFRAEKKFFYPYHRPKNDQIYYVDGQLNENQLNLSLARSLEKLEIWGNHLPAPIFANYFQLLDYRNLSKNYQKLLLQNQSNNQQYQACGYFLPNEIPKNKLIQAIYQLTINRFDNQEKLELLIHNLKIID